MSQENNLLSASVKEAYLRGEEDETLEPRVLMKAGGTPAGRLRPGDGVIFYNLRGEREIQLTRSLTEPGFDRFPVSLDLGLRFATLIEYQKDLAVQVAFAPPGTIRDTLSEVISRQGLSQVKITEGEKAFHVTYFFNGKREEPFPGERRVIVPTRKDVALFDEAPEMSLEGIKDAVAREIGEGTDRFILVNLPNVDVVGHVENPGAVVKAVEAVDRAAYFIVERAEEAGITVLVVADHGSVERWYYPGGLVDTGHTDSPVPFILVHPGKPELAGGGELADVAPTVLEILGLPVPPAMTGKSLLARGAGEPAARTLLLILDGWGLREEAEGNLIARAHTPAMDRLLREYPSTKLRAAGESVGLPPKTVGNSEAGHLHLGAGRRIYADRMRVNRAVSDGSFFKNEAFLSVMREVKGKKKALHLLGIVSFFSSHGSLDHLFALMEMARREGLPEVYIHAMLGRRGELPESGARYVAMVEQRAKELGVGEVVSVIGRYWSLDREENWDRIEKTYRMLVEGKGIPVGIT